MRSPWAALVALWSLCVFSSPAAAQPGAGQWVGGAPMQTRVAVGASGEAWVGVWVDAPATTPTVIAHVPMAVSLVVDTSGSMAGPKIENARLAAAALIESLSDGDIVSVYGFATSVTEIAPPTVLGPASRGMLLSNVAHLVAGGGTNLEGGLRAGVSRMAGAPATHPTRRVFIISDGLANVGITDPRQLGYLAAAATEVGTQVTAIGVGYDYDPSTLSQLAVQSAGRMHHLGSPEQMGPILETELSWMARSVALGAVLEVRPATGVVILEAATTGAVIEGGVLRLPLGAITAGQRRELLFRVRMPTTRIGATPLATASLRYGSPDGATTGTQSASLSLEVARDASGASASPRVAAMLAQHEASEAERAAATLLEQGRREEAIARLDAARTAVATTTTQYDFADEEVAGALEARRAELDSAVSGARAATTSSAMHERSYELQAAPMTADGY
ncbi:MAG: VWA domain-containing protein [Sandaracinus sp.]